MRTLILGCVAFALAGPAAPTIADTECRGWGDVRDFRFKGEAINLSSNLFITSPDETRTVQLGDQSRARGTRNGNRQVYTGTLALGAAGTGGPGGTGGGRRRVTPDGPAGVAIRMQYDDTAPDTTVFDLQASATADVTLGGVYYRFNLPRSDFAGATAELIGATPDDAANRTIPLAALPQGTTRYAEATVKSVRVSGKTSRLEIAFASPSPIVIQENRGGGVRDGGIALVIPIGKGNLSANQPFHTQFTLKASCDLDTAPVKLAVDTTRPGPTFIGIGGNFRLQSPVDPAHIAYNLDNLRVVWGRVEMPLSSWQTSENADPVAQADAGQMRNNVRQAMEMARTLARKKIPIVISDWSAPEWAVAPGGGRGGRRISADKWPAMYKGITSYIATMKKHFEAEPLLFSFNEADMGINVKLTPEDQRTVIKELGAAFAAQGLATKMLLGDTGNPTPRPADYLEPTVADPEAMRYVGAVSYHCWTGGSDPIIARWGEIAQKFHHPLLIAEGGTDPGSYRYPGLFLEPWYSLDEINLYLRCIALSRPASILHWQLTENMGVLTGGRDGKPLRPTQRFFNLKQLNLTPPEAPSVVVTSDRPHITAAAYGDPSHGYAFHLINTGATRTVTLTGLPADLKQLYVSVTDAARNMQALPPVRVNDGCAEITLDLQSYVTLTSTEP